VALNDTMKDITKLLLPVGSLRRKSVRGILVKLGLKSNILAGYYNTWFSQQNENLRFREQLNYTSTDTLITIVVPVFNPAPQHIEELVYSIISQAYQNWELILVNASSKPETREIINKYNLKDDRIKVFEVENGGISHNTNYGIKRANGDYIAFVDHDDVLEPFALYEIVRAIINTSADVIYTDEDKISENGEIYFDPHFKPDWSPDLLTHVNYINHLTVIKKNLINKAGLLDQTKDGAQDYDLLLRVTDLKPIITHVPKVLYHWRATQNSTAQDFSSKRNITDAGRASLEEHFSRQGLTTKVNPKKDSPGFYELQFKSYEKVSLIITPFASDALLRIYTELLIKRTLIDKLHVEIITPTGSIRSGLKVDNLEIKTLPTGNSFLGDAISSVSNDKVVIISQVVLPQDKNWLERLCGPLFQMHVGAVAPLILRNSLVIEDCGLVRNAYGQLMPLFTNRPAFHNQTFFGNTDWVRDVDALTGAIVATSTKLLHQFLISNKTNNYARDLLKNFTENVAKLGKYNVILTDVTFDNYAIRLKPDISKESLFNINILPIGNDYELYSPESSAINILTKIFEQEEVL